MSAFYGTVQGNRGQASRQGFKNGCIITQATSWSGAIQVIVDQNDNGQDRYNVIAIPWRGQGVRKIIAQGFFSDLQD